MHEQHRSSEEKLEHRIAVHQAFHYELSFRAIC
jgi:hypothetical protein